MYSYFKGDLKYLEPWTANTYTRYIGGKNNAGIILQLTPLLILNDKYKE